MSNLKNYCWLLFQQWRDGAAEPNQIEVVKALLGARDAMLEIRCNMRKMGEAAGIPVSSLTFFIFNLVCYLAFSVYLNQLLKSVRF